ncbi:hypothetical protein [Acidimangrovimonas pyrenivorans]|uniref:Lipoprotein n=1 Tax=Acidimangrovimonas pyrenivorans TaxID=2030798 RepID=A0ABV7AF04_9RHOB
MMKYLGILALVALAACSFNPERMYYQVTQRSANGVSIQVNKGNMDMKAPELAQVLDHMDDMATKECRGMGKTKAARKAQRHYRTGPYYDWIERAYICK